MSKKIIIVLCCVLAFLIWDNYFPKPKKGMVIRYEVYKGCKVPIKADGKGGSYRWIGDVPWDKFTIEEKVAMAFGRGGKLSNKDIQEIKEKYGVR